MTDTADPRNVNSRLYNQIATLLDDLEAEDIREKLDIKERIAAIIAIGRIQIMFVNLRKENPNVRPRAGAGSTARKYASAFRAKAHATRRGAKVAGRRSAAADDIGDDGGFADDAAE